MPARTWLGVCFLSLLPGTAFAQATSTASSQAAELFEQGRTLATRQDFNAACPKFVDSAKLEPKVGTFLNLADCEEHLGQFVAARGHWLDAVGLARSTNDARAAVAQQRLAAIEPRVAKLAVTLRAPAPDGVRVTRDGVELGAGSLGTELPVDPGAHTVVVAGAGQENRTYSVTLVPGETTRLVVEPGARLAPTPVAPAPAPAPGSTWSNQKTIALVVGGAGMAGIAVGSIFGVMAISQNSTANSSLGCTSGSSACSSMSGVNERDSAHRAGNVSTVAFIAGGAALATGVVLWFTARHAASGAGASSARTTLAIGPASAAIRGVF